MDLDQDANAVKAKIEKMLIKEINSRLSDIIRMGHFNANVVMRID